MGVGHMDFDAFAALDLALGTRTGIWPQRAEPCMPFQGQCCLAPFAVSWEVCDLRHLLMDLPTSVAFI